jgi:hypothetical protein
MSHHRPTRILAATAAPKSSSGAAFVILHSVNGKSPRSRTAISIADGPAGEEPTGSGPFISAAAERLVTVVDNGRWHILQLPAPVYQFLDRFYAGDFPQAEEQ